MMSAPRIFGMYLNARVYARRSDLFAQARFEELLSYGDLGVMIRNLLSSPYEHDLSEALLNKKDADAIEEAVGRHLDRIFTELAQISKAEPFYQRNVLLFTHRWDLAAVKSLLRRCAVGAESPFGGLVTGPSLPWPVLEQFGDLRTLDTLVPALAAAVPMVCAHFPEVYLEHRDDDRAALLALETALDTRYFERCIGPLTYLPNGQILREYLRLEVDRINMRGLFVSLLAGGADAPNWLRGGFLSPERMSEMHASGSLEQAVVMLGETPYRAIHQVFYYIVQTRRLATFDRRFEMLLVERLHRLVHAHAYGAALFMHFLWSKWIEGANLRVLARGVEAHLPAGRIRDELIYV